MTFAQWAARATQTLVGAGRGEDESRREAALLARWHLGWPMARWVTNLDQPAPAEFVAGIAPAIARRARAEPIAYITGEREFFGHTFRVTPDVLVPRPETELVVEEALTCLRSGRLDSARSPLVLDVGTGSGCIGISIALEHPDARIVATDVSDAALAVAADNARRLGVADRLTLRRGSLLAGWREPIDLIVSNPPYIATTDRNSLPADVVDYEPATALFAGSDGLDIIRALVPAAAAALEPGGWLIIEMGLGQADDVQRLIEETPGLRAIGLRADLQGILRVAIGRRSL